MQIILGLLFSIFSLSLMAQDKMAMTMGDDHAGGKKFVKGQNIHANKKLKESGYKVATFYGDEAGAKSVSKTLGSYARPFTFENVEKSLNHIYSKPCSERPKQLMINFVAHGSRNGIDAVTKKSVPRHSVNGLKKNGEGKYSKERIYADRFANLIKKNKKKDSGCDRPVLAIFDHSCKSGASTSVFKGLGCVMTSTSGHNSASTEFIHDSFDRMKSNVGNSMADLHLDLLVNQDVSLVNIDYKDGKKLLQKVYNNTNQISGCGDESKVNYGSYAKEVTKPYAPLCREFVPFFTEKRDAEFDSVKKIVTRLRVDEGIDKEALAKAAGVEPSKVPDSSGLSQRIDDLIETDLNEIDKMKTLAIEESKLMAHEDIKKSMSCNMSAKSSRSSFSGGEGAKNMAKTICKTLYKSERAQHLCAASSHGKRLNIGIKDLFRLQRELSVFPTKLSTGQMKFDLSKSGKPYSLGARSTSSFDVLTSTVKDCLKKIGSSGSEAQKKAVAFFNKNYKKEELSCNSSTIGCHKVKAESREKEIKQYLSYARGYSFLSCKAKLNKSDDLKACEDFKI